MASRGRWPVLVALTAALLWTAGIPAPIRAAPQVAGLTARGTLVGMEPLGTLDRARLQAIAGDLPGGVAVATGAQLFRVTYWTVFKGAPAQASGLLAVPDGVGAAKGVVMYLHGTNITRALAPSQPDRVDGNEEAAVFAGNGYIVALPDYLGLGSSKLVQPYLIVAPQVDASIDLLIAVRAAMRDLRRGWSPQLFLMGFSQGGQSVAALHRQLERTPLAGYRLRGSVAVAGPYNLRRLLVEKLQPENAIKLVNRGYLGLATYAYSSYHDRPLAEVFKPEWAVKLPQLFDGEHTFEQVVADLPDDGRDFFAPGFLAALAGGKNWFAARLDDNQSFDWTPRAPLKLFHGLADDDVPASSSIEFAARAKSQGGNISLVTLPGADHQESSALSYAPALQWFDTLARRR